MTAASPPPPPPPAEAMPIGVFDSGVGGLTVVAALTRRLPHESILYLGDTARLPYGTKSPATVVRYTRRNVDFLAGRGVRAVVVACNTASALALPELSGSGPAQPGVPGGTSVWGVPTWGVIEPGARRAAAVSRGKVGVIATESTVASDAYGRALRRLRPGLEVISQACPLFVPLVEEGWQDDPITEQVATRYLAPLLAAGIDTLVLGCTHYPLLAPVLARLAGPDVTLVDSAESTADDVAAGLASTAPSPGSPSPSSPSPSSPSPSNIASSSDAAAPVHHFCVTDAAERFARIARQILGEAGGALELVEVV